MAAFLSLLLYWYDLSRRFFIGLSAYMTRYLAALALVGTATTIATKASVKMIENFIIKSDTL